MTWHPTQYLMFNAERFAPFDDLLKLVELRHQIKVIDLGCGTGELTKRLADYLPQSEVLGIDNSPIMLEKAERFGQPGLRFELRTIEKISGKWDLIFSNASIHWVADHPSLITQLFKSLNPGGQIVVQIPSGIRNRAQLAVMEIAEREPYLSAMNSWKWVFPVLPVHEYAEILFRLGAQDITAFEKVYPHVLTNTDAVFDWVAGTTMNAYFNRLPEDLHDKFKEDVREKIKASYSGSPTFFPFRRIFFAGKRDA